MASFGHFMFFFLFFYILALLSTFCYFIELFHLLTLFPPMFYHFWALLCTFWHYGPFSYVNSIQVPFTCMHPKGPNSVNKLYFFLCRFAMGSLLLLWTPEGWKSVPKWSFFSYVHSIRGPFYLYAPRKPELWFINCPFCYSHFLWGHFCCYEPQRAENLPINGPFSYVHSIWGPFYLYAPRGPKLCP